MYYVNNSLHHFNTDVSPYTWHIYCHKAPLARQPLLFYAAISEKKNLALYLGLYDRGQEWNRYTVPLDARRSSLVTFNPTQSLVMHFREITCQGTLYFD